MIGTILDCTYETIQNRVIQKVRWKIWPCNFNGTPLLTNLFSCARLVFLSICPIVQYSFCPFVHLSFCSFDLTRVHSIWSGVEKPIALFHTLWLRCIYYCQRMTESSDDVIELWFFLLWEWQLMTSAEVFLNTSGQFHQNFTSSFCANFLEPKKY